MKLKEIYGDKMKFMAIQGGSILAEADNLEELASILFNEGWQAEQVGCMLSIFEVKQIDFRVNIPSRSYEIERIDTRKPLVIPQPERG